MNIEKLFLDTNLLENKYNYFVKKRLLRKIQPSPDLITAHIKKAGHNMMFFEKNKNDSEFNDWLIVVLYYALYHAVLALIVNKNYVSKNHTASLVFLIKHYCLEKEDIQLLNELSFKKEDAEFYTQLKKDRQKANYESKISFTNEQIKNYKLKVTELIQKIEFLIDEDI